MTTAPFSGQGSCLTKIGRRRQAWPTFTKTWIFSSWEASRSLIYGVQVTFQRTDSFRILMPVASGTRSLGQASCFKPNFFSPPTCSRCHSVSRYPDLFLPSGAGIASAGLYELNPLFERDGLKFLGTAVGGNLDTWADEIAVSGANESSFIWSWTVSLRN